VRALKKGRSQRVEALAAGLRSLSQGELTTLARGVDVLERVVGRA
jgi:hypothetical protein